MRPAFVESSVARSNQAASQPHTHTHTADLEGRTIHPHRCCPSPPGGSHQGRGCAPCTPACVGCIGSSRCSGASCNKAVLQPHTQPTWGASPTQALPLLQPQPPSQLPPLPPTHTHTTTHTRPGVCRLLCGHPVRRPGGSRRPHRQTGQRPRSSSRRRRAAAVHQRIRGRQHPGARLRLACSVSGTTGGGGGEGGGGGGGLYTSAFVADSIQALVFGLLAL